MGSDEEFADLAAAACASRGYAIAAAGDRPRPEWSSVEIQQVLSTLMES